MLNRNVNFRLTPKVVKESKEAAAAQSTPRRWLRLISIVLLALLTAAVVFLLLVNLVWTGLPAGTTAPHIQASTLDGQEIDLTQMRGQPVMLTFWSPDCFACREELPAMQALATDPAVDMQLVTVVSRMERAEVQRFAAEQGLTFPIIVDPAGAIAKEYAVSGIPFTYFIDQNGQIDQAVMGSGKEGELQNTLFTWLESCQIGEVCTVE